MDERTHETTDLEPPGRPLLKLIAGCILVAFAAALVGLVLTLLGSPEPYGPDQPEGAPAAPTTETVAPERPPP